MMWSRARIGGDGVLGYCYPQNNPKRLFMAIGDVEDTINKVLHALQLGPEDVFAENRLRLVKELAQVFVAEDVGHAVAEAAGRDMDAIVLEVFDFFEVAILFKNSGSRSSGLSRDHSSGIIRDIS